MGDDEITMVLETVDGGPVPLPVLLDAQRALLDLLRALQREVAPGTEPIDWACTITNTADREEARQ